MPDRWLLKLTCTALLTTALVSFSGCDDRTRETRLLTTVREERGAPPVAQPPTEVIATQGAFSEVSRRLTPSVVNIATARLAPTRQIDPFFRDFFGDLLPQEQPSQRKEQSLGSGFILSADGYLLTNAHVVKGAQEIKVKLSDNQVYAGKVVGVDPRTDIAVLKIEPKEKLTPVVLGDSDQLQVGQWAIAIGNPFGLDRTVTVGVVSAIGRANVGIEDYEDFIQTDASINPGNSGGPLLNIYGEVIGINTAIVSSGQGIGFAIPINLARLISRQLMEQGSVTRGWLGVSLQPLTPELARSFGLDQPTGTLVNQIQSGSPAEKAGMRRGDILLTFGGKEVRGVRELQLLVASTPVGQKVPVEIYRNGRKETLLILIAAQEASKTAVASGAEPSRTLGFSVVPSDEGTGVLIDRIDPQSNAAAAGAQAGDLLISINHVEVNSPAEFAQVAKKIHHGGNIVLFLRRDGVTLYLAFPAN